MGRFCFIVLTAAWLVVAKADATDDVTEPPCADSEILDKCPVDCPSDYCPTSRCDDQSSCPKPASADCPAPACKCRFNYRRATNGTCIPTRECPPFDCDGDNEEYNPCPPLCPGESCSQATEDGECHRVGRIGIVLPCKPACRCKKYFWRQDGVCVPYEQCIPSCTRPHEKHAFVMDCPPERSCKNRGIEFSCLADQKREQKCVCDEGYVRNESNECIEEENCDKCSEPNEEYTNCKRTCPPELCISIIALFNCKADEPCEAGCACKPGHYRQQNNTSCIPACQCQEMEGTTECRATIEQ